MSKLRLSTQPPLPARATRVWVKTALLVPHTWKEEKKTTFRMKDFSFFNELHQNARMHCLQKAPFSSNEVISAFSFLDQHQVWCEPAWRCVCAWESEKNRILLQAVHMGQTLSNLCYLTVVKEHMLPNLQGEFIKPTKSVLLCMCKLEYGHHYDTNTGFAVADSLITTIYAKRQNTNNAG